MQVHSKSEDRLCFDYDYRSDDDDDEKLDQGVEPDVIEWNWQQPVTHNKQYRQMLPIDIKLPYQPPGTPDHYYRINHHKLTTLANTCQLQQSSHISEEETETELYNTHQEIDQLQFYLEQPC